MSKSPASKGLTPVATGQLGFVLVISLAAALGGFLFGFDTAVINGAVKAIESHFAASPVVIGFSVASALIGSAVGAFFAGPIADRLGRTRAMLIASILFTISAIGSGLPFSFIDFSFWRLVGGAAVGAASVIAPAYIAEVAPAHLRGRLGSLQQLAIVSGIFIALLSDYFIATAAGSAQNPFWFGFSAWRWMFWSEIPAALLYGWAALRIPESPRYLVAKGQDTAAAQVLGQVLGGDVQAKVAEIRQTVLTERKPQLSDLLDRHNHILPIVWIGMGLSMFQQFVGINVIFYYSSVLWQAVGFTEKNALEITVITSVVNIATTLLAIASIDRFGRKPLLLVGSVGMVLTLGTLAWVFSNAPVVNGQPSLNASTGMVALVAANLYVFCFGFSWGPVIWVLLGEMFNNKIRAMALAVSAAVQWLANWVITVSFPVMLRGWGLGSAYGFYTVAAAASFFFVWFLVRETKGKELEQM